MKKLLFVLVLILPCLAEAQESYTINATATQVTDLDRSREADNRDLCARYNLVVGGTCTQAALCTAANAAGGSSCTAGQARAANVRLYPGAQAGREEYLTFELAAPGFRLAKNRAIASESAAYCIWFKAQNTTVRNAECAKSGVSAGCELCQ